MCSLSCLLGLLAVRACLASHSCGVAKLPSGAMRALQACRPRALSSVAGLTVAAKRNAHILHNRHTPTRKAYEVPAPERAASPPAARRPAAAAPEPTSVDEEEEAPPRTPAVAPRRTARRLLDFHSPYTPSTAASTPDFMLQEQVKALQAQLALLTAPQARFFLYLSTRWRACLALVFPSKVCYWRA
jgi:hypothetical protein